MSGPFGFRTARIASEDALRLQILLALGRRLQPAPTLAALAAAPSLSLADDDLRFVQEMGFVYRWRRAESAPPDVAIIIAPDDLAPGKPGRWVRTTSTLSVGYLERCELYNEDIDEETMQERLFAKKPAVLISFDSARHKPVSHRAGALYWYIANYNLLVISTNMRGGDAAWHGSPRFSEAAVLPGTAAILGDLKTVLAGSNLGLDDVERVELGDERPVIVALAKRTVVEQLTITVWSSIRNEDTDLARLELDVQRQLLDDHGVAVDYGPADSLSDS